MNVRRMAIAVVVTALLVGLGGVVPATGSDEPALGRITGTVTYRGKPVKGVRIALSSDRYGKWQNTATTDANGVYEIDDAPVGERKVRARSKGFLTTFAPNTVRLYDARDVTVSSGETSTVDIALRAAASVSGKVVDSRGRPLAGVPVIASNTIRAGSGRDWTNKHGNYVISGLAAGPVEVFVNEWDSDWERVVGEGSAQVKTQAGKRVRASLIRIKNFPTPGKVIGQVSRVKPYDTLNLFNTKTKELTFLYARNSGSTLTIKKREIEPGTYRVLVNGLNHASKKFTVKSGQTVRIPKFKGPRGKRGKVEGIVSTWKGVPLSDTVVSVTDAYGTSTDKTDYTGKSGKFTVRGLNKGSYTITAETRYEEHAATTDTLTVRKRGKTIRKLLSLGKTYTVTGRLTAKGKPRAGVEVYLNEYSAETGDGDVVDWTDEDGSFILKNIPGGKQRFIFYDDFTGGYPTLVRTLKVKKSTSWDVKFEG